MPSLTRRRFLAASTAAAALPAAPSVAAAPAGAATATRIDCQSHLFVPEQLAVMEKRTADPRVFTRDGTRYIQMGDWLRKVPPLYTDVASKLAVMDAAGIALTALSINDPGPEWFGADGPAMAQLQNDYIAGLSRKHSTRFFGLFVLPTQDIRASLAEMDRCVRQLGMKGWLLYTNLAGEFPDERKFRPLFARAVELDLPVLLHPAKPITTDLVKAYELTSTLGNMFDNTIALTRLIMSGLLDDFPKLKLVCPHLGGSRSPCSSAARRISSASRATTFARSTWTSSHPCPRRCASPSISAVPTSSSSRATTRGCSRRRSSTRCSRSSFPL